VFSDPVAYFLTFTTYGTWLHGRAEGSVKRSENLFGDPTIPPDPAIEKQMRDKMRQPEYSLDKPRRVIVKDTIAEVCRHRDWILHAVHVRSNHVHVVVSAPVSPEQVLRDLKVKAWSSRRIRELTFEAADRIRWTTHGSTRYLWDDSSLADAIEYVVERQGEPMEVVRRRSLDI